MGAMMTAFAEGMALADASGLQQADLLEVVSLGAMGDRARGGRLIACMGALWASAHGAAGLLA